MESLLIGYQTKKQKNKKAIFLCKEMAFLAENFFDYNSDKHNYRGNDDSDDYKFHLIQFQTKLN